MQVAVRCLVAPGAAVGTLRAWVGVFEHDAVPSLTWFVDDVEVKAPQVIRSLAPVAGWSDVRAATGVVDLPGLVPGRVHRVRVVAVGDADGVQASATVVGRPLPERLPASAMEFFNVLLVSCFDRRRDTAGRAGALVETLTGTDAPDLVLTVGDQVYLDQPPTIFRKRRDLAVVFDAKYRGGFADAGGYSSILRAAPVAAIPDDHEYWNNFPHRSAMTPQTLFEGSRRGWTEAARALYDAYQLGRPDEYSYRFDVEPLSFLMLDNRTFRDESTTMRRRDRALFEAWTQAMLTSRSVPVIVTGPSLFQPARAGLQRSMDRNIANYDDYPVLMRGLLRLARAGRPVLALTGDVHYGRVTDATVFGMDAGSTSSTGFVREVIASPAALVAPFHHTSATVPPARFTPDPASGPMTLRKVWPGSDDVKGNNVALLQFRRNGPNVELRIRYWIIGSQPPHAYHDIPARKLTL